ncbi:MAG: TonB family protein [Bdellovibrionales bacterium]|nr:TonB family protein [Oligoflexia bacterium]
MGISFRKRAFWMSIFLHLAIVAIGGAFLYSRTQISTQQINEVSLGNTQAKISGEAKHVTMGKRLRGNLNKGSEGERSPITPEREARSGLNESSLEGESLATNAVATNGVVTSDAETAGARSASADYAALIVAKIRQQERMPIEARKRKLEGTVDVEFEVAEQGTLLELRTHAEWQLSILETAAREAVEAAAPFPPPPGGKKQKFRIPIEFKLKTYR